MSMDRQRLLSQIIMKDTAGLIKQLTGAFTWQPKKQRFRNGNNNYLDIGSMQAYSYNWWCYFTVINGIGVFNAYKYSVTTGGHQSRMRDLLHTLGIEIHYTVYTRSSISGWDLHDTMQNLVQQRSEIEANMAKLVRKVSNKRSDLERQLLYINDDINSLAEILKTRKVA